MSLDLTVLMPTLNRAETLRRTLDGMTRVRRDGLSVEFVVIDNGSSDHTPAVLHSFRDRLPLTCLRDAVTGKSHALNHAFSHVELGQTVVFTDDDITADEGWLKTIVATCERWPEHQVFGGPIEPEWPNGWSPPEWAKQNIIQALAFARHDLGDQEREYPADVDPFGGNFWVRRTVIAGARFDERIGAHPTRQILGDETQFLQQLRRRGMVPVYTPLAKVKHRVNAAQATKRSVFRRALQGGLGTVYVRGLPEKPLFHACRRQWFSNRLSCVAGLLEHLPRRVSAGDESQRVLSTVLLIWALAEHGQALRLALSADRGLLDWISHCPEVSKPRVGEGRALREGWLERYRFWQRAASRKTRASDESKAR